MKLTFLQKRPTINKIIKGIYSMLDRDKFYGEKQSKAKG